MLSQCAWQSSCSPVCGGRGGGLLAVTLLEVLCGGQRQPGHWGRLVVRLCGGIFFSRAKQIKVDSSWMEKGIPNYNCWILYIWMQFLFIYLLIHVFICSFIYFRKQNR